MLNKTFSMIKPDAVKRNITGEINKMIEDNGFIIIAQKLIHISIDQARGFYLCHKDRPFYDELVNYISSYPVIAQVLKKDNAVSDYRQLMGATNPTLAAAGTIRAKFGLNIGNNSVHGSDSNENAVNEIHFFFKDSEIFDR